MCADPRAMVGLLATEDFSFPPDLQPTPGAFSTFGCESKQKKKKKNEELQQQEERKKRKKEKKKGKKEESLKWKTF